MKIGASLISLIRRAMRVQSSSLIRPARMSASRIRASADSNRMTISDLLISRENTALVMPCLTEQDRAKSSPSVVVRRNTNVASLTTTPSHVHRLRLPEPRPRRHHDHLARVQAVRGGVEVREAGGHAQRHAAAGGDGVDLVHRGLQQLFEGDVVFARAALGDLVDRRLGAVDDVVDLAALGAVVAELDDPGSGLDEAPQRGLLGDDLGVVRGVRGGGDGRDQRVQVGGAAEADQVAPALQLRGDRDRVGGLAAAVEVEDALVDGLVRGAVEVVGPQDLDDVRDRVLAQEHAAEHRLLGGEVLRGLPVERRQVGTRSRCVAGGAHRPGTARCTIVRHGHTQRHPRSTVYRTCVRYAWGVRRFSVWGRGGTRDRRNPLRGEARRPRSGNQAGRRSHLWTAWGWRGRRPAACPEQPVDNVGTTT